jgi:hypothetical protein
LARPASRATDVKSLRNVVLLYIDAIDGCTHCGQHIVLASDYADGSMSACVRRATSGGRSGRGSSR